MPHTTRPCNPAAIAACLVLGLSPTLALTGCGHPLAQRSPVWWNPVRVLQDNDPDHRDAKIRPAPTAGEYHLALEWRDGEDYTAARLHRPAATTLTKGQPIGFTRNDDGQILAVAGDFSRVLTPGEGFHYVWYKKGTPLGNAITFTGYSVALVAVGTAVLLLDSLDDDDDDRYAHHH
ncbi:MAG: hypothetical protein AAGI68_02065 [Planctomycetota bacterium]